MPQIHIDPKLAHDTEIAVINAVRQVVTPSRVASEVASIAQPDGEHRHDHRTAKEILAAIEHALFGLAVDVGEAEAKSAGAPAAIVDAVGDAAKSAVEG